MEEIKKQQTQQLEMYDIKIKFDGETHMIEANTFINSLIHFTNIVQETNSELAPNKKVEVRIKASKEGSFEVELALASFTVIDAVKSIFEADNLAYVVSLGTVVGWLYKVAKHLGGKKPKEITSDEKNTINITNYNGEVSNFDFKGATIYLNNPKIQEAISQSFETLERDDKVTGFELLDKNDKPIVVIEKEEFPLMTLDEHEVISTTEKILPVINASLNILSLDWELKKKWDFYYLGNKISSKIKDDVFADRINKGERFAKGDTLLVDLEIKQEFDETVNTFVNKSYRIVKINKHIERPQQAHIDFESINKLVGEPKKAKRLNPPKDDSKKE